MYKLLKLGMLPVKWFIFLKDYLNFKKMAFGLHTVRWRDRYVCLNDNSPGTSFDPHYVYHTSWAARKIALIKPEKHVDIGSCLRFSTITSAFIPTDFYDYRPPVIILPGLYAGRADLLSLPFETDSIASLSCMHVIEHVGLGRYGDPLDPSGDTKAITELKRVLKPGGKLLFVVLIASESRIQFNAHRVYSKKDVLDFFSGFELLEFSLVPDEYNGGMILDPSAEILSKQSYACGCFLFTK